MIEMDVHIKKNNYLVILFCLIIIKGYFFTSDKLENMNIPCVYINDKDKKGYIPDLTRYTGLLHRGYDIYNWTQFLNSSYNL